MSHVPPPPSDRPAFKDPLTRKALRVYGAKAVGWLLLAPLLFLPGAPLVDEMGDPVHGVPWPIPYAFFALAFLAASIGVFGLLRLAQITWATVRRPWVVVDAQFGIYGLEASPSLLPNGQPILELTDGTHEWILTPAAVAWRWNRFDTDSLLLAAGPRRGGAVATMDRQSIAWGGRSVLSAGIIWLTRRLLARPSKGRHAAQVVPPEAAQGS